MIVFTRNKKFFSTLPWDRARTFWRTGCRNSKKAAQNIWDDLKSVDTGGIQDKHLDHLNYNFSQKIKNLRKINKLQWGPSRTFSLIFLQIYQIFSTWLMIFGIFNRCQWDPKLWCPCWNILELENIDLIYDLGARARNRVTCVRFRGCLTTVATRPRASLL